MMVRLFLLLTLWIGTTATGIWYARNREFAANQRSMIRSVALTWAAVMLRVYPPVQTASFGFDTGYMLVAWLCWVSNLLVGEWPARRVGPRPKAQPVGA